MDINQRWKVQVTLPHPDPRVLRLLRYPILMEEPGGKVKVILRCSVDEDRFHYGEVKGEFAEFSLPHEPTPDERQDLGMLERKDIPPWAITLAEEVVSLRNELADLKKWAGERETDYKEAQAYWEAGKAEKEG